MMVSAFKAGLFLGAAATLSSRAAGTCKHGSNFGNVTTFWEPDWNPAHIDEMISHRAVPFVTQQHGYVVQSGNVGVNRWANTSQFTHLDELGAPYANGLVDHKTGLPTSTEGGWTPANEDLHEYWEEGFVPERFNILLQKGSAAANVALLENQPVGEIGTPGLANETSVRQNILRLTTRYNISQHPVDSSGALVQTADLFASGFFEIKARLPAVEGVIFAMWTFHYETHREPGDPVLEGKTDEQ